MRQIAALLMALLIAGCGGGQQQQEAAVARLPQSQELRAPQAAPASGTRRVLAGLYVDTDVNGTAAQVYRLYRAAFSRIADTGGLGYQVGQIEVLRLSLQQVAANFVRSPEFTSTYGSLTDTQFVTLLYANVLHRAPDDGGLNYHVTNLQNGLPRAIVLLGFSESPENKAQTASEVAAGLSFVPWPNGRVYLTDGNYFETDPSGMAAQVFRLYQAALGRPADAVGFGYQVGNVELVGLALPQLAQNFMNSPEFVQKYGSLSNTDFVTQLYANVLHRAPDSGGLVYWTNLLATGTARANVLLGFSESPENINNTLDAVFAGLRFQPWPSAPSMPAVTAPTGVTGTAAIGDPLAGATITLKDSFNRSATATARADGRFRIDTTGLAPPFLLRASTSGAPIYSVSTSSSNNATINITPITDSVARSWYLLKSQSVETAFGSTTTMPAPTPQQAASILQVLSPVLQLGAQASGVTISNPQDLIAQPFLANGTGMDLLVRNTHVTLRSGGLDFAITAGTATQQTAWNIDAAAGTITANSTTTGSGATSTSVITTVIPVQPAQSAALEAINNLLTSLSTVVASANGAVTSAALLPYFDPGLLNEGADRTAFVAHLASDLSGVQTLTFSILQVQSLDTDAGAAKVLLSLTLTATNSSQSGSETETLYFRRVNGNWLVTGDGRIAQISVKAEARRDQGGFGESAGPSVNLDVRPPKNLVTGVSASSSFGIPGFSRGPTEVESSGAQLDTFFSNTGVLSLPLPPAGTPVTLTLTRSAGGTVQYVVPINAWTTELIRVTAPTTTVIAPGPLTVQWTRPTTYAVVRAQASAIVFTGSQSDPNSFSCNHDETQVSASASSAQLQIPATCNGLPVLYINLNVHTEGPNGERSIVIYGATRGN